MVIPPTEGRGSETRNGIKQRNSMKIKLIIKKSDIGDKLILTHIKMLTDGGQYSKFIKQTPAIIDWLNKLELILPTSLEDGAKQ